MKVVFERGENLEALGMLYHGQCFKYDSHVYMKIRLKCSGFSYQKGGSQDACLNLKSGTMRLLPKDLCVNVVEAVAHISNKKGQQCG
jgi:hypothetical protein